MTYNQALKICDAHLLPSIAALYGFDGYEIRPITAHDGGRNLVYTCEKENAIPKIIRIAFLNDRNRQDFLAETEYVRYLFDNGGSVSNVVNARNGKLVEEVVYQGHTFFVCAFDKAKGKRLVENNYCYREGIPITEYYYNCGKVLGEIHQLSKRYTPKHQRYSFLDKFNAEYMDKLIPDSLSLVKEKFVHLLGVLKGLAQDNGVYGMLHFDYSDGNYNIDFETGQITVYDFDNACFGWYLYDLASLWTHGVGWIQFEHDTEKRRAFMDDYFSAVLEGYRSETEIADATLEMLPLFIKVTEMENIVDAFEVARNNGDEPVCDEAMGYLVRCIEEDIPYKGFFHEIYSCEEPFEHEARRF